MMNTEMASFITFSSKMNGVPDPEMKPIITELYNDNICTVEEMKRLDDEKWKSYKVPKAVLKKIKESLGKVSHTPQTTE